MTQVECPACRAPMWLGGSCPWDNGSGCRGLQLRVNVTNRPASVRPAILKVASVPTERAKRPLRPGFRGLRPGERAANKAAYQRERRGPRPLAVCAYDGAEFVARYPSRAKYCSPVHRGRVERAA